MSNFEVKLLVFGLKVKKDLINAFKYIGVCLEDMAKSFMKISQANRKYKYYWGRGYGVI